MKHPERIASLGATAKRAIMKGPESRLTRIIRHYRASALLARAIGLPSVPNRTVEKACIDWNGVRANKSGDWKPIRKARGPEGDALAFWSRWHSGATGGSLWGPMMRTRGPLEDGIDSVVQVSRYVASNGDSMNTGAVGQWRAALGR